MTSDSMKILDFQRYKKEHDHQLSQSRFENRLAFNTELPSLITSNPGEFALYENGVRTGLFPSTQAAKEKANSQGFSIFEITPGE